MFSRRRVAQLPREVSSLVETFTKVLWAKCFGIDPVCWRNILDRQTHETTPSGETLFVYKHYRIRGIDRRLRVRFTFEKREEGWLLSAIALMHAETPQVYFSIYYNVVGDFLEYPSGEFPWEELWGILIGTWVSRTTISDPGNVIFRP